MREPGTFASLTPTLLARKGGAKPAMRPQLSPMPNFDGSLARDIHEDLGWNDMGHEPEEHESGEVIPLGVHPAPAKAVVPAVVRQQKALPHQVAATPHETRRSAFDQGRRAAFTLRVDVERHLRLRLACTLSNRSAQQLVTEALDRLLEDLPEVSTLAAHLAAKR